MPAHLDEPLASAPVDPLCFFVRGWAWMAERDSDVVALEIYAGETLVGTTRSRYLRPDVNAAHKLAQGARTGFELYAHHPLAPKERFEIQLRALFRDGTRTAPLHSLGVDSIGRDYRQHHFGVLLDRATLGIQHRVNIFSEGPSQAIGSPEVSALLRRHLPAPPTRVIDIGCGLGSYGRTLLTDGYDWMGAEVDAADCAELARLGLPHRQVDGRTLPFADGEFDAALCIEVLEHIEDPYTFLREVHRVAPRQLIVSVPNCELLSYLNEHGSTPWHMLEADHKNFYTRWSLGALLGAYYPHVEVGFHTPFPLRTREGTPLHNHLFAVASQG